MSEWWVDVAARWIVGIALVLLAVMALASYLSPEDDDRP